MEDLVLGEYRLIKRIGIGGMAEVFLSEKTGPLGTKKLFAIKKLLPQLTKDKEVLKRFEDEARLSLLLDHPNILKVFDVGKDNDDLYLVSEYIEGEDLNWIIKELNNKKEHMPVDMAVTILLKVAQALSYAHDLKDEDERPLNIVHRDVSPSNVMISLHGDVKLMDFGIAVFESRQARTMPGRIQGKLGYIAPELIRGKSADQRSDIFSFGVMAYELLTGRLPFEGNNDAELIQNILKGNVVPIEQQRPDVDKRLRHIINNCLAIRREDRYQKMDHVYEDLYGLAKEMGYVLTDAEIGRFLRKLKGMPVTSPNNIQKKGTIALKNTFKNRKRYLVFIGIVLIIGAVIGTIAWYTKTRKHKNNFTKVQDRYVTLQSIQPKNSKGALIDIRNQVLIRPVMLNRRERDKIKIETKGKEHVRHVQVKKKVEPEGQGMVVFRYFPARAAVFIDNKRIDSNNTNVIKYRLSKGMHTLVIKDQMSDRMWKKRIKVLDNQVLNLGTITLMNNLVE